MKHLTLMRHAKSSWENSRQSDHERPLNERGRRDAPMMASRLLDRDCIPDLLLCSSAQRTRETAAFIIDCLSLKPQTLEVVDALYLASTATLRALIESTNEALGHVMIIGHNPGLEDFAQELHHRAPAAMPTCAVAHFSIAGDAMTLSEPDNISLDFYDFPKSSA